MSNLLVRVYLIAISVISLISEKLSNRIKENVLFASSFVIALFGITRYCNDRIQHLVGYGGSSIRWLSTMIFLVVLVTIAERRQFKRKVNGLFMVGWLLCFVTMFALSFVHPVKKDYFLWSILSISLLPMIMIAESQNDRWYKLTIIVAKSFVLASFVFIAMSLLITPFTTKVGIYDEFVGICQNPNSNGMICTAFYTSALYLLIVEKRNKFIYLLSICFCIAITIISVCRTGELAIIIETIIAALVFFEHRELYKTDVNRRRAVTALLVAILLSVSLGYVLSAVDAIDLNAYAISDFEEASEWVCSNDLRIMINNASSYRLLIWRAYSRHLTPFGNGRINEPLMPEIEASKWAHNNALDIGYVSGYFAMAGYIILLLAVIAFIIKCLLKKKTYRREYLLPILAFSGYFVQAMLEVTIYPMSNGTAFLCFITLGSVAFIQDDNNAE